jgi:uncharacterized protein DUF4390
MQLRLTRWALLVAALAISAAARADPPHIAPLVVDVRGSDLFITFVLNGAVDPDLARRIESGLETAIDYDVRLLERNRYWFDQELESHRFRVTAAYNPVRREYVVRDFWDRKPAGTVATGEFTEAARLLVARTRLPTFRVRRGWPHKHLYVKMRAAYDAGHFFALAPVESSTEWKKSKTVKVHDADLR